MKIILPEKKPSGRLTLMRQPKAITGAEFNTLSFEDRLSVISTRESKDKYQLLCKAEDSARIVESLSSHELLLLAKDLGLQAFSDILELVTPEQFTNFVDFDCWTGDRFNPDAALEWLEALLEGTEPETAFALLQGMDHTLLILIVKKLLDFFVEENADTNSEHDEGQEGRSDVFKTAEAVIKLIRNHDPQLLQELFLAAVSECESSLEEEVYHFQQGRLQDQGFPDYWEARKIYLFLDPDRLLSQQTGEINSGGLPETCPPGFAAGLQDNLIAPELGATGSPQELMWELTFLVNKVLVAERLPWGDSDQIRTVMAEIKDTIQVGQEFILEKCAKEPETGFPHISLETLFRLGFSVMLGLGNKARDLRETGIAAFLDGPFREFLKCLTLPKPLFYLGLENTLSSGNRRFAGLEDIRKAEDWLAGIEVQRRLFENHFTFNLNLFISPQGEDSGSGEEIVLSDIFLTALANRLLGRKFHPGPLAADDLAPLHQRISDKGKLRHELREETAAWLESLEKGGGDFALFCLEIWEEEFCPLQPDALDPDYVGGLLIGAD
jgi:hypothetical protein